MVAVVASLRRLSPLGSGRLPTRLWWAGATALTLLAVAGGVLSGWLPRYYSLTWVQILLLGLAISAHRHNLHLRAIRFDRVLLWAVLGSVIVEEIIYEGLQLRDWDLLLDTGVLAFVVAIEMVDRLSQRLNAAVTRLADRGVLIINRDTRNKALLRLEPQAGKWAKVAGPAVAAMMLLAWVAIAVSAAGIEKVLSHFIIVLFYPPLIFESVAGWVAGVSIAHMFAAGRSWRSFRQDSLGWHLIPDHPDQAGGFKPIGDFFFYQCLIAGIPAVYLGTWGLLIPLIRAFHYYSLWFKPYLFLLGAAITLEVIVFVVPMWSVHVIMRREKAKLLARADGLSIRIGTMQRQLQARRVSNYQQIKDSIAELKEEYKRIERAPTWPIDPSVRRRFNLSNLALFLPFVGYAFGGKDLWQTISNVLEGIK